MIPPVASHDRTAARFLAAAVCLVLAGGVSAHAQGHLKAHYRISMIGVTIGYVRWSVEIGDSAYATTASGKAGGIFSVLFSGEGAVKTEGAVANGHLSPSSFAFRINDEDGKSEFLVSFVDGVARMRTSREVEPSENRVPITEKDRHGVMDPLSAVLIPGMTGVDTLAPENCARVLKIFDGRRRYDLALSFIRVDRVKLAGSYAGPVLVCRVILKPVAGYRPDSKLVKYVAGRSDMELWFAPIDGTAVLAPLRVAMPTLLGTLKIQAEQFDSAAASPPPPTANSEMPSR